MPKRYSMFWNWMRWQCLNVDDWNDGEIPAGTMIDDDQVPVQLLKLAVGRRRKTITLNKGKKFSVTDKPITKNMPFTINVY